MLMVKIPNSIKFYNFKKLTMKYITPFISLLSALFTFQLALEDDSSITDQQSSALIVGGIFLSIIFILSIIKAFKSEFMK